MAYFLGKGTDAAVQPGRPRTTGAGMATAGAPAGTQDVQLRGIAEAGQFEPAVDTACAAACRERNRACRRAAARRREDPGAMQACVDALRECLEGCRGEPPPPPPPPTDECVTPQDCIEKYGTLQKGGEWRCVEGECKKYIVPQVECESDEDCAAGFYCGEDNKCHPERITECETEQDCIAKYGSAPAGSHWKCDEAGKCKKVIDLAECESDEDCGDGFYCGDDNKCHPIKEFACTTAEDCVNEYGDPGEGYYYVCEDSICKKRKEGVNGDEDEDEGCEGGYPKGTSPVCATGYEVRGIGGEAWCCPTEEVPTLGEWEWPPEMRDFYEQLLGYGRDILGKGPYGGLGRFDLPEYLTGLFPQFAERAGELAQPYALPEDIQRLMGGLATRGEEFLGRRPGYSDAVMRAMFGRDFERVRERGGRRAEEEMALARREGLAGTGAMRGLTSDIAWQTEQDVTNLMRDLFLAQEAQKRQDRYGYTEAAQRITDDLARLRFGEEEMGLARAGEARGLAGTVGQMLFGEEAARMGRLGYGMEQKRMAQDIFGQGMGYNQMIEAINAARRGEQQNALSMLLSYLFGMGQMWG